MKLKMFEAEAEVLGKVRAVQFREGGLMLTGLSYEDAMEVLRLLGPKTEGVPSPRITGPSTATPQKQPEKGAVSVRADAASKPAPEPELKSTTVAEFANTARADLKLAKELEGVKEPGSDGAEIPEKISKSTRFIEVMEWVMTTQKLKPAQVDEIVAACEALKDIPAVRRVRDIRDKVISNLAAYAEAGAGDAA